MEASEQLKESVKYIFRKCEDSGFCHRSSDGRGNFLCTLRFPTELQRYCPYADVDKKTNPLWNENLDMYRCSARA